MAREGVQQLWAGDEGGDREQGQHGHDEEEGAGAGTRGVGAEGVEEEGAGEEAGLGQQEAGEAGTESQKV